MGTRKKRQRQENLWYGGELATAPGHPFYTRLNEVLDAAAAPPELRRVPGVELRREAIPLSPLDDGTGFRLLRADGSDSPLAGTTSPP